MHVIIVKLRIKPEHVAEFERTMTDHIKWTRRNEPGCLQFDVCVDKASPRTYWLYEIYKDDKALADHGKSETLGPLLARLKVLTEEQVAINATRWPEIRP
jgi:quinol monooxygenase YgiN